MGCRSRLPGAGRRFCLKGLGGAQALPSLQPLALPVANQPAQPLDAGRQHRQGNGARKAVRAMRAHPAQAAVLQVADRRLDARMALAGTPEPVLGLPLCGLAAQPPLYRQGALVQPHGQLPLVARRMETPVEARHAQLRMPLLCGLDHRHRMLHVAPLPHHLMVQDEPVLVLDYAHRHPDLHRTAGLALGNPARMRLEDRERLLAMGHRLPLQQPTPNLPGLALGMSQKVPDPLRLAALGTRQVPAAGLAERVPDPVQVLLADRQAARNPFRGPLRQLRGAHPAERLLHHLPGDVFMLAPARNAQSSRDSRAAWRIVHRIASQSSPTSVG